MFKQTKKLWDKGNQKLQTQSQSLQGLDSLISPERLSLVMFRTIQTSQPSTKMPVRPLASITVPADL
jgi:ribosome recycling factor